jgi:outer membrane protein assembly factor BamB
MPAWQFQTAGQVWRILFSDSGRIVGEDRDDEKKEVTFFCLDEVSGEMLWRGVKFDERWWIGIETIYAGIVYLHEYVKPDLPQHQKIIALDIQTGKLLWRNDELQPLFVTGGKFYAAKSSFERRVFYELNPATGEVERELSEGNENPLFLREREGVLHQDFTFPEVLGRGPSGESELELTMRSYCEPDKVVGNIEYVHRDDLLFFNYHERSSPLSVDPPILKNTFIVVSMKRSRALYSEVLNEKVHAPTPDSFFLKDSQLFYVKNKSLLVAIRLDEFRRRA